MCVCVCDYIMNKGIVHSECIVYDLRVLNQFQFSQDTRSACIPISIVALYYMNDYLVKKKMDMTNEDFQFIMTRGGQIWKIWSISHPSEYFPSVKEILSINSSLYTREYIAELALYKDERIIERGGLVLNQPGIENTEGDLSNTIRSIVEIVILQHRPIFCLLVVPSSACICLVFEPIDDNNTHIYRIYFFDSHGKKESNYCDFVKFLDCTSCVNYILTKYYNSLHRLYDTSSYYDRSMYTEEELTSFTSYSLFYVVK